MGLSEKGSGTTVLAVLGLFVGVISLLSQFIFLSIAFETNQRQEEELKNLQAHAEIRVTKALIERSVDILKTQGDLDEPIGVWKWIVDVRPKIIVEIENDGGKPFSIGPFHVKDDEGKLIATLNPLKDRLETYDKEVIEFVEIHPLAIDDTLRDPCNMLGNSELNPCPSEAPAPRV
jgi:hypothetical protein